MTKIPYPLKLALFLVILGSICGALLAAVNGVTAPIIEKMKIDQIQAKLEEVVPYENVTFAEATLKDKVKGIVAGYVGSVNGEEVAIVYHGRRQGYASTIEALVSVDLKTGNVLGISIISEQETSGKDIVNFDYGLPGKSINNANNNFQKVSGATVSSEAIKALVLNVQAQHAKYSK